MLAAAGTTFETIEEVDQPGRKVAVKLGTTGHASAQEYLARAELMVLNEENACVLEVMQGKVDVFFYDQLSVYRNWQRYPEQTRAVLAPFQQEAWAVAIRKGDDGLRTQVNEFLADFRAQGGFELLAETHLPEMKASFEKLGYPFVF
jgi:polar amino acid transport system substrate-binding protein